MSIASLGATSILSAIAIVAGLLLLTSFVDRRFSLQILIDGVHRALEPALP